MDLLKLKNFQVPSKLCQKPYLSLGEKAIPFLHEGENNLVPFY